MIPLRIRSAIATVMWEGFHDFGEFASSSMKVQLRPAQLTTGTAQGKRHDREHRRQCEAAEDLPGDSPTHARGHPESAIQPGRARGRKGEDRPEILRLGGEQRENRWRDQDETKEEPAGSGVRRPAGWR